MSNKVTNEAESTVVRSHTDIEEPEFSPCRVDSNIPVVSVATPQRITVDQRYILLGATYARTMYLGRIDGSRVSDIYDGIMKILRGDSGFVDGDFVFRGTKYSDVRFRQMVNDLVARGLMTKTVTIWYDKRGEMRRPKPHYSVTQAGAEAIAANVQRGLRDVLALKPEWQDYGDPDEYARRRGAGSAGVAMAAGVMVAAEQVPDRYTRQLEAKREQTRLRQITRLTEGLPPDAAERVRAELMAAAPRTAMARRGSKKHGRGELLGIMAVDMAGTHEAPAHSRAILDQYIRLDKRIGMHYLMITLRKLTEDNMIESAWEPWKDYRGKPRNPRWHWRLTQRGRRFLAWAKKELERQHGGVLKVAPLARWDDPGAEGARDVR